MARERARNKTNPTNNKAIMDKRNGIRITTKACELWIKHQGELKSCTKKGWTDNKKGAKSGRTKATIEKETKGQTRCKLDANDTETANLQILKHKNKYMKQADPGE